MEVFAQEWRKSACLRQCILYPGKTEIRNDGSIADQRAPYPHNAATWAAHSAYKEKLSRCKINKARSIILVPQLVRVLRLPSLGRRDDSCNSKSANKLISFILEDGLVCTHNTGMKRSSGSRSEWAEEEPNCHPDQIWLTRAMLCLQRTGSSWSFLTNTMCSGVQAGRQPPADTEKCKPWPSAHWSKQVLQWLPWIWLHWWHFLPSVNHSRCLNTLLETHQMALDNLCSGKEKIHCYPLLRLSADRTSGCVFIIADL